MTNRSHLDELDRLRAENAKLREALTTLKREAQAVADDHHRPRYTRLDQAIETARAALKGPT